MMYCGSRRSRRWIWAWLGLSLPLAGAETFTIATYNVENYLVTGTETRSPKPEVARRQVVECILALRPDVLALQEIGGTTALADLRSALSTAGLAYAHWELVEGFDTNTQVALLSRFPIVARRPHTRLGFLLYGRRFRTSRGFAEVDIRVNDHYQFTLVNAHLKSRREIAAADQGELREQEARLLRRLIEQRLGEDPSVNLVVLGDFNDNPDSPPLKVILGRRGSSGLVDTRPTERNGDDQPHPNPRYPPRRIAWTHYFGKEETYSRVDYILLSSGMAGEWDRSGTYVLALPNWGTASDHRPIVARFNARDR